MPVKRTRDQWQALVIDACERDDNSGFCLACGEENFGCEPDMRNGPCEACGANKVYGAQELLFHFVG